MTEIITGNHFNKYESKSPLVKWMMKNFKKELDRLIKKSEAKTIFDVGCGEGYLMDFIIKNNEVSIKGIDITEEIVKEAKRLHPSLNVEVGSAYNIKEENNSYDCVTCNEVMEHLEDYEKAITEMKRISKKYVIISVPHEHWWRIVNVLRGKYWEDLGNTPGHVNNWTTKELKKLLQNNFSKVEIKSVAMWNFALCEKEIETSKEEIKIDEKKEEEIKNEKKVQEKSEKVIENDKNE